MFLYYNFSLGEDNQKNFNVTIYFHMQVTFYLQAKKM